MQYGTWKILIARLRTPVSPGVACRDYTEMKLYAQLLADMFKKDSEESGPV